MVTFVAAGCLRPVYLPTTEQAEQRCNFHNIAARRMWKSDPSNISVAATIHWLTTRQTSALFSARRCFAGLHSDAVKAPFVSAKLRRKGTKSADFSSHICAPAARNACSGAAAVIGAALGQVNDFAACWCAGFRSRRFVSFLVLYVTHEQLRKRELHGASVLDWNDHFFMRLLRVEPSGRNGNDFWRVWACQILG